MVDCGGLRSMIIASLHEAAAALLKLDSEPVLGVALNGVELRAISGDVVINSARGRYAEG